MKAKILSGSAIAVAAAALVLAGASPAVAKRHHHHHPKHKVEKNGCAAKASCASKKDEKGAPAAPESAK